MAGEEENLAVKLNYLRDAAGYILVIDGTRGSTFDVAVSIQEREHRRAAVCRRGHSLAFLEAIRRVSLGIQGRTAVP
jgi:hypothetical protein